MSRTKATARTGTRDRKDVPRQPPAPHVDPVACLEAARTRLAEVATLAWAADQAAVLPPRSAPEYERAVGRLLILVEVLGRSASAALNETDREIALVHRNLDAPF